VNVQFRFFTRMILLATQEEGKKNARALRVVIRIDSLLKIKKEEGGWRAFVRQGRGGRKKGSGDHVGLPLRKRARACLLAALSGGREEEKG